MLENSNRTTKSTMPCPNPACGKLLVITLEDLLYKKSIQCPFCLLELTMSREINTIDKQQFAISDEKNLKK